MTKGKVVLVPFPFDDLTTTKVRPAVCLTEPIGPYRHVIVAFISSRISVDFAPTDIILSEDIEHFESTGLRVASVLRLHRMVTLTTSLIRRELGQLPPLCREEVDQKLALLFGLKNG